MDKVYLNTGKYIIASIKQAIRYQQKHLKGYGRTLIDKYCESISYNHCHGKIEDIINNIKTLTKTIDEIDPNKVYISSKTKLSIFDECDILFEIEGTLYYSPTNITTNHMCCVYSNSDIRTSLGLFSIYEVDIDTYYIKDEAIGSMVYADNNIVDKNDILFISESFDKAEEFVDMMKIFAKSIPAPTDEYNNQKDE